MDETTKWFKVRPSEGKPSDPTAGGVGIAALMTDDEFQRRYGPEPSAMSIQVDDGLDLWRLFAAVRAAGTTRRTDHAGD